MADKVTTNHDLKLLAKFVDNDTRTIDIPDPKTGLTKTTINTAAATIKETGCLIGDKTGADFLSFVKAVDLKKTDIKLDLN